MKAPFLCFSTYTYVKTYVYVLKHKKSYLTSSSKYRLSKSNEPAKLKHRIWNPNLIRVKWYQKKMYLRKVIPVWFKIANWLATILLDSLHLVHLDKLTVCCVRWIVNIYVSSYKARNIPIIYKKWKCCHR